MVAVLAQVLVDCVKANGTNGCNGGDPTAAYAYILDHGVPDETCSNYEVMASWTTSFWFDHQLHSLVLSSLSLPSCMDSDPHTLGTQWTGTMPPVTGYCKHIKLCLCCAHGLTPSNGKSQTVLQNQRTNI